MINILPITIESLVALLLLLTILYCVRLNHQLTRLKADGTTMQATIAELMSATESAERAITGLKATVREADETLGQRLQDAERYSVEMRRNATAGAEVLNRLTQIAGARLMGTEPAELAESTSPLPDARSIGSAAQAIADRVRARASARSIAA